MQKYFKNYLTILKIYGIFIIIRQEFGNIWELNLENLKEDKAWMRRNLSQSGLK